jgi:ankyrin repeat protein
MPVFIAGSGKTIFWFVIYELLPYNQLMSLLSSAIIEDIKVMCNAGLALMAYFYFDFRDIHKQNLRDTISSLLFQLSTQSSHCQDILYRLYLLHNSGAREPSDDTLTECLKDVLSLPSKVPVYIIMDAIDECSDTAVIPSPREEILDLVEQLVNNSNLPNLRLCVTSRPEFDIQDVLDRLSPFSVSLYDEIGQKQDIANYIRDFIALEQNMRIWAKEDKELVINVLTERADGMSEPHYAPIRLCSCCLLSRFRLVLCQLEMLRRLPPQSVRSSLNELPKTLDETYERILKGIEDPDNARRLLQCLAVAIRPLRVEELAAAIDFDARAVLSACSSLIEVITIGDSQLVQFSHPSVKEFLTSDRLAESSGRVSSYYISLESAHTILAKACLGVLLRLEDHPDRDSIEMFPLAEYAAKHWVDHARFENVASHINEAMELLFDPDKPHFANWVWVYDMDEPLRLPTPRPIRPNATPLYYAALCGLSSLVERLIVERHADVNARGGHYGTAIQAALYKRHLSTVRILIGHGSDVNSRDDDGSSLLHTAVQIGDPEIVSLLLSHGADVQATDSGHSPVLFIALDTGNLAVIQLLIEHGADVNVQDDNLSTALHITSGIGDLNTVRVLLQYGAEVNPRDNHGSTPLHLASTKGNDAVVRLLVEDGANMDASDNSNSTPLHLAFINQNLDIAALLIENGADAMVLDNKILTPSHLHLASAMGNLTVVNLLIDKVDLNALDETNSTPLHLALINGNSDIAKLLIKKLANVNIPDNKGQISLHLALFNKDFDLVELLIQYGVDVNARSKNNSTPLHFASYHSPHGKRKFIDVLLAHGGDPNVRDGSGLSPLHIASRKGDIEIAKSLLEGGAKVNLKDWMRQTPLHVASNNQKMALLLVQHGADAFALDHNGAMPLQFGTANRNKQSHGLRGSVP